MNENPARPSWVKQSRDNWSDGEQFSGDTRVAVGCLQRIATATEAMAQNWQPLVAERDWLKRKLDDERERIKCLRRSNAALRGTITRMKKERNKA